MSVKRQVVIFVLTSLALIAVPPFMYTLVTGNTGLPEWLSVPRVLLLIAWLFFGAIYLVVGAAIRHNRRAE